MSLLSFVKDNLRWLSVGFLLALVSAFGQTYFISIFSGDIRRQFDLSNGEWGAIYTAGTAASAVLMVWLGGVVDRFRVRALMPVVLGLLALACVTMAMVSAAWALVGVILMLRFTGQGMASHLGAVAMARWFTASRGKALAIGALGFALGESLFPLTFVALKRWFDWQSLWLLAAALALAVIPVILILLRHERTPQSLAEQDDVAGMGRRHWTRMDALRHPLFWLVVPALMGPSAFITSFFFLQVHLATLKGWLHLSLVALFPLFSGMSTVAMLLSGLAVDRIGTARLMPLYLIPLAIGFLVLSVAQSLALAALALALMALTAGVNTTVINAFWAEFYGTRHLGSIKALAVAVMVFGSAVGPGLTGWFIDRGVVFTEQMVAIAIYLILASLSVGVGVGLARKQLSLPA